VYLKKINSLLHPFQSFVPVIDWVREAAADPTVVSIKQTLYRTNESSELVAALAEAARCGTEVTVVIELTARFDEEENINFANIFARSWSGGSLRGNGIQNARKKCFCSFGGKTAYSSVTFIWELVIIT